MKLPGAITIVLATAATAFAAPDKVVVCSELGIPFAIAQAESIAGTIFSTAGVRIDWRRPAGCPADAIRIDYSYRTAHDFMPVSLAYSLPYDGVHIVVFYDRILERSGKGLFPTVLGHVIAHEITHILEGVNRHSAAGIMKANWTAKDYEEMVFHPLTFDAEDVDLIHRGLQPREARVAGLR